MPGPATLDGGNAECEWVQLKHLTSLYIPTQTLKALIDICLAHYCAKHSAHKGCWNDVCVFLPEPSLAARTLLSLIPVLVVGKPLSTLPLSKRYMNGAVFQNLVRANMCGHITEKDAATAQYPLGSDQRALPE